MQFVRVNNFHFPVNPTQINVRQDVLKAKIFVTYLLITQYNVRFAHASCICAGYASVICRPVTLYAF